MRLYEKDELVPSRHFLSQIDQSIVRTELVNVMLLVTAVEFAHLFCEEVRLVRPADAQCPYHGPCYTTLPPLSGCEGGERASRVRKKMKVTLTAKAVSEGVILYTFLSSNMQLLVLDS